MDDNDISAEKLARAKQMMPLADETSQAILAASGFMELLDSHNRDVPVHHGNKHDDVTGFYTRRRKR